MGEEVLKEGYLVKAPDLAKHLHQFKKWQRRWCQLYTTGDLCYYDNEKSTKPAGVIHLGQCNRLFDAKSRGVQTSFCAGIDTGDSTYYLKAESAKMFREWIKPMSEFAEVCEIDMDTIEDRRGLFIAEGSRRGTLSDRERTDSVQSRHLSVTTASKFQTKEGWLAKTGSNNKGWKDRYFKLQNGKLFYYKNEKSDTTSLGDIDLFKCTAVETASGKKGHGIDLHLPGRLYNLSADSREEQEQWMAAISHSVSIIRDIKDTPTSRMDTPTLGVPRSTSDASISSTDKELTVSGPRTTSHEDKTDEQPPTVPPAEDTRDIVQLLEAEVEALRGQVTSLQGDLKSSTTRTNQLQEELSEVKRSHSQRERELTEDMSQLQAQVTRLERSKQELETVNDSVRTQLDEQIERVQELEEELVLNRQDLDASAAVEEELSETQQRLQEIEAVAQELEAALRKRESEPPTPLSSSFKGLTEHAQYVDTVEQAAAKLEGGASNDLIAELESEIAQLTSDKQSLSTQLAQSQGSTEQSKEIVEERLKWQMEMETLRRDLTSGFHDERDGWNQERRTLETQLAGLREQVSQLESQDQLVRLEQQLTQSRDRVAELESKVERGRERLGQLQVQKDKAVTDLIALRKTNKSIEKRMSESEDARVPSPMSSLVLASSRPDTPDVTCRIGELERKVEELTTALTEAHNERDQLKAKVDRLTSSIHSTPDFMFKTKTGSSAVGVTTTANGRPSLSNGSVHSSDTDLSNQDAPPPKPKRPPRELITRHSQRGPVHTHNGGSEALPLDSRLRTRTASFLKSIKTMMM